ncbi:MAG: hypothetical protein RIR11_11 [Bacteroidota bacterium]
MRILSTLLLLSFFNVLFGQSIVQNSIYFDLDKAELTPISIENLQALAQNLATMPDYEIKINAFTDNSGSTAYNDQLALNRGLAVQTFLENKGIITEKTVLRGWGEQKQQFSNQTEEGRRKNRRVDVEITTWTIDNPVVFRQRLLGKKEQTFIIDPSKDETITSAKGVLVVVPAGSFVEEDGTKPRGAVQVLVKEALRPGDWIAHNLSTISNGALLQSGGMAAVEAFSEGRPLRLADDAEITIGIPALQKVDLDMRLFYGIHSEEGTDSSAAATPVTWQVATSNEKFRQELESSEFSRPLDSLLAKRLQQLKVNIPAKPTLPVYAFNVEFPKDPILPKKPRVSATPPDREQINKIFTKKGKMTAKQQKRAHQMYAERYKLYLQDSVACDRSLQNYNAMMQAYLEEKAIYDKKLATWVSTLTQRTSALQEYLSAMYDHKYAIALSNTLKKAGKSKKVIKFQNLEFKLRKQTETVTIDLLKRDKDVMAAKRQLMQDRLDMSVFNPKTRKREDINFEGQMPNSRLLYADCTEDLDCRREKMLTMNKNIGLKAISDSIFTIDREKILASGSSTSKNEKLKMYITEVTRLGWFNCDRFANDPAPKIALNYNQPDAFAMYAYFPKLNGMINLYKDDDGYFSTPNIPIGQTIQLLSFKTADGRVWMDKQTIIAGQQAAPNFDFKAYSMVDIRKALDLL